MATSTTPEGGLKKRTRTLLLLDATTLLYIYLDVIDSFNNTWRRLEETNKVSIAS